MASPGEVPLLDECIGGGLMRLSPPAGPAVEGGGIEDITSVFLGALQPLWPGLGGTYCTEIMRISKSIKV